MLCLFIVHSVSRPNPENDIQNLFVQFNYVGVTDRLVIPGDNLICTASNPFPRPMNNLVDMNLFTVSNRRGNWYIGLYSISHKISTRFFPVLCPKLTLIQPTWSAYPYHLVFLIWCPYSLVFLIWYTYALTSLYGNTAHCSGYGVAMGCYGLFIVTSTAIVTSQWYDLYSFTEYARTWARHANARRLQTVNRHIFVGFNAICYAFLRRNNPIYIVGRNCSFSAVPGLLNKCSGLRPSDIELVAWLATSYARG